MGKLWSPTGKETWPKCFSVSLSQHKILLSSLTGHYQGPFNKKSTYYSIFPNEFNNIFTQIE